MRQHFKNLSYFEVMTSWILLRFRNKKQQQQRERKRSRVRGRETAHLIELLCRKFLSLPLLENWSTKGAWLISVSACCHILRHGHPFPQPPRLYTTLIARREKMRFSIEAREEKTAAEVAMATQGEGNGSGEGEGRLLLFHCVARKYSIFNFLASENKRRAKSAKRMREINSIILLLPMPIANLIVFWGHE